ncbi:MAG: hypothetical protein ACI4EW_04990 [Butyrivibrio sp.]
MRKTAFVLAAIFIATTMLSACSNDKENVKETVSEQTTESETVVDEEVVFDVSNITSERQVTIDGSKAKTEENNLYEGMGFISANNSSRLLLDYKDENPEAYWEILNYVFGEDGLDISLYKLEMGADVDSSSGTEPAIKRTEDEVADVTRGAAYQLAADALTINPDLKIDMLYWGMPSWIKAATTADEKYAAISKWYKETIDAMYDTYGIKVSYITAGQNEHSVEPNLVKLLAETLENAQDERYDYSSIQIVAGEGVETWKIADKMLNDEELMDIVDVVSSHYTSFTDDNTKKIKAENGKKAWFSEGSSPMKKETLAHNREESGSGIGGLNGTLDIATRITQAMTEGMTMYEFQPLISSYYNGATYFPKQLITANEPWSGAYSLDAGYYMTLHFSRFIKTGWQYIDDACYGDGVPGGDGHAIVDSTYNYITCTDPATGDYSMVIVNNSEKTLKYNINVKNVAKAAEKVYFWETVDEYDGTGDYYDSFFNKLGYVTPTEAEDGSYNYTVVIKPYSMATVSTLDIKDVDYTDRSDDYKLLDLDYEDDFEYSEYDEDYLSTRGMAPRYTTDQGGAFEVESTDDGNILMQKINYEIKGKEWGRTSDPITTLGDDRWQNYTVSIDAHFAENPVEEETANYVSVGARYNFACNDYSGYSVRVNIDGEVILLKDKTEVEKVTIDNFDTSVWHNLKVSTIDNVITVYIDDEKKIEYTDNDNIINSGRVSIGSAYQNNYFDNLKVTAEEDNYSITRVDDMDSSLTFSKGSTSEDGEGWYFNTMCSFSNFNRTITVGETDDYFSFEFEGTHFAVLGTHSSAVLKIEVDGQVVEESYSCNSSKERTSLYFNYGLEEGKHSVKVTVVSGKANIDTIEYK